MVYVNFSGKSMVGLGENSDTERQKTHHAKVHGLRGISRGIRAFLKPFWFHFKQNVVGWILDQHPPSACSESAKLKRAGFGTNHGQKWFVWWIFICLIILLQTQCQEYRAKSPVGRASQPGGPLNVPSEVKYLLWVSPLESPLGGSLLSLFDSTRSLWISWGKLPHGG